MMCGSLQMANSGGSKFASSGKYRRDGKNFGQGKNAQISYPSANRGYRTMIRRYCVAFLVVLTLMTATAGITLGDKSIQVFVGNTPLDMKGANPAIISNSIYVPLRPIVEAFGADVVWNGTSSVQINPQKLGTEQVRLLMNNYYPNQYGGSDYNMPPIIYFNQQLDMALIWDPYLYMFRWMPIVPPRPGMHKPPMIIYRPETNVQENQPAPSPEPYYSPPVPQAQTPARPAPAVKSITGEVVRAIPSRTNPRIVVQVGGNTYNYPVSKNVVVLRGRTGGRSLEMALRDVRPGDVVTLEINDQSLVTVIRAQFMVLSGKVQSIAMGTILLDSGNALRITSDTEVILPNNTRGDAKDIQAGDVIMARVNPTSVVAYVVKVMPADGSKTPASNADDQISFNSAGPLKAGDVLVINFKAQPGGQAQFTIPGIIGDVSMAEIDAGTYRGEYKVRIGDSMIRQRIKVTFSTPAGATYVRLSQMPVTIQTGAAYRPQILYPRQGQEISSPIIVKGQADPGAIVRVTIEYSANIQHVLPIDGTASVEEVQADSNGHWQTPPMPAVVPFDEDRSTLPDYFGVFSGLFMYPENTPVTYTVTAVMVGANGEDQASYSVDVTKKVARVLGS